MLPGYQARFLMRKAENQGNEPFIFFWHQDELAKPAHFTVL